MKSILAVKLKKTLPWITVAWLKKMSVFVGIILFLLSQNALVVSALSQDDLHSIYNDSVWYHSEGGISSATTQCAPTTGSTGLGGAVYLVGDSIGGQIQGSLASRFSSFKANVADGRNITGGLGAIDQDQAFIQTAKSVVIELGTNGGVTAANVNQIINNIRGLNPSAIIYWVDTAVAGRPSYAPTLSQVNSVIYSQSSALGFQVISWNKKVFGGSADPTRIDPNAVDINGYIRQADQFVHLTNKGVPAMTELIASSVGSGGGSNASGTCVCSGGTTTLTGSDNAQKTWNYFIGKGLSPVQAAAILGNFNQESGIIPNRTQGGGSSDTVPLDGATGYGIAQWTDIGRQRNLDQFARSQGRAVSSLELQLDFTYKEMTDGNVWNTLKTIGNVKTATEYFHDSFERSADNAAGIQERVDDAIKFLALYGSGGGSTGGGTTGGCGPGAGGGGVGTSPDGFVFPLRTTQATVKQGFNGQRWCYESQSNCHHDYNAADIIINTGTPVLAVRNGTIANIRVGPARLVLLADNGRSYFYTHMGAGTITVREGQTVKAGDVLGAVGTDVDGEGIRHLHIDELPRPPYDYRPGCSNASCQAYPFFNVQPELINAFSTLPV